MTGREHILITGGAGYIGSHVAWRLKDAGYIPVTIDNFCNGHQWAVKFGPLEEGDIGNESFVRDVCTKYQPVALMHFAAFIEVGESVKHPEKYWDNNFERAKRLFQTIHDCGVTQTVFSSTAAVYGAPTHDSALVERDLLKPINPYGETKLAAEEALRGMTHMQSVALRYFNASGAAPENVGIGEAHWPETHLVPRVILAALGYEKLAIYGTDYPTPDGTALRDYIHVCDLADAHVAALRYLLEGGATEVCNLGTGRGYSVKEIVATVVAQIGRDFPVTYEARRAGDPPKLVADASRARQILGWKPQYGLAEIIKSALDWHRGSAYRQAVLMPHYGAFKQP